MPRDRTVSLVGFEIHLNHVAPAFRCYASGHRSEELNLVGRVQNNLSPPATDKDLAELDAMLRTQFEDVRRLYEKHYCLVLYEDKRSDAAGIAFFPIAQWHEHSREMRAQLIETGLAESNVPYGLLTRIVFGEISHSANYFALQTLAHLLAVFSTSITTTGEKNPLRVHSTTFWRLFCAILPILCTIWVATRGTPMARRKRNGYRNYTFPMSTILAHNNRVHRSSGGGRVLKSESIATAR